MIPCNQPIAYWFFSLVPLCVAFDCRATHAAGQNTVLREQLLDVLAHDRLITVGSVLAWNHVRGVRGAV